MDHIVKFELVDLAGIEPGEAVTYVLEQPAQLFPVIGADEFARCAPFGLVSRFTFARVRRHHSANVRR